jgi:hypothetical protein
MNLDDIMHGTECVGGIERDLRFDDEPDSPEGIALEEIEAELRRQGRWHELICYTAEQRGGATFAVHVEPISRA